MASTTGLRMWCRTRSCNNANSSCARSFSPIDQNAMEIRGMPHSTRDSSSRSSGSKAANISSACSGRPCHSSERDNMAAACRPPPPSTAARASSSPSGRLER
ncbi:Uncharacterised protein [Mycobacteroides abscessus subsp. abscessus]|nr:Uncharacterised protein [Mycobacteroides abscessus subsp. abscessus]